MQLEITEEGNIKVGNETPLELFIAKMKTNPKEFQQRHACLIHIPTNTKVVFGVEFLTHFYGFTEPAVCEFTRQEKKQYKTALKEWAFNRIKIQLQEPLKKKKKEKKC